MLVIHVLSCEFGAGECDELVVGVGMSCDSPASVLRLGEEDPRAFGDRWVSCCFGHDGGQPADGLDLLGRSRAPALVRTWTRT